MEEAADDEVAGEDGKGAGDQTGWAGALAATGAGTPETTTGETVGGGETMMVGEAGFKAAAETADSEAEERREGGGVLIGRATEGVGAATGAEGARGVAGTRGGGDADVGTAGV